MLSRRAPIRPEDVPSPLALTDQQVTGLRELQLQLLAELDRVCAAIGVEYFALYGTALGAVRHEGFIPWDDDLDIGMLRTDYDRLVGAIDAHLGEQFLFQTVDNDPHYGCMFGKLRLRDTRCVDRISYGSEQHGGVFIDVFPLDAKASAPIAHREQKVMRYVGFRLLYLKSRYLFMGGTSLLSRTVQVIARTGIRLVPRSAIVALTRRVTRLGDQDSPAELVSLFGAYLYDRDTMDADWIRPLRRVPFETRTIPVMGDVEAYLTQIYGDYRQLPPPEQRVGQHQIVELNLGP